MPMVWSQRIKSRLMNDRHLFCEIDEPRRVDCLLRVLVNEGFLIFDHCGYAEGQIHLSGGHTGWLVAPADMLGGGTSAANGYPAYVITNKRASPPNRLDGL